MGMLAGFGVDVSGIRDGGLIGCNRGGAQRNSIWSSLLNRSSYGQEPQLDSTT